VWWIDLLIVAVAMFGAGATVAWLVGRNMVRKARKLPGVRRLPLIGVQEAPGPADDSADLRAYPLRLESLERRLEELHRGVQAQLQVLHTRRADVLAKGGRDDLARKYLEDAELLDRRAERMRRVMGLVWKTRAVLLLRVHMAVTARRRPRLARLPRPGEPVRHLGSATASYLEAATAVRFFVDLVAERGQAIEAQVPPVPPSGEVDEAGHQAVRAEIDAVRSAHARLRERMDRLADNLTYLGDRFATLAALEQSGEPGVADGGAERLLEEVNAGIQGLSELAGSMDHAMADAAVSRIGEEVGRLEVAGAEADAESAAHLEVDRLLGGVRH
jgi:hypothetical protein